MAKIYFKINASDIRRAVKEKVNDPIIALTKNPSALYKIAQRASEIVEPYVPMNAGSLRRSVHIVQNSRGTRLVWGDQTVVENYVTRTGKLRQVSTKDYAAHQHNADDSSWRRHTSGTKSYWTNELRRGSSGFYELIKFAAPLMKKEVKRDSK